VSGRVTEQAGITADGIERIATRRSCPSAGRVFFRTLAVTWGLVVLGGAACGLLFAGVASIALVVFTIPGGLVLGALLGVPIGLAMAIVFTRWASPPADAVAFTRRVEAVGKGLAMLASVSMSLVTYITRAIHETSSLMALALIANGLFAIVATALVGRECGHALAVAHLDRFGVIAPARSPLWRTRIGTPVTIDALRRGRG
jgi:hypothetical protein